MKRTPDRRVCAKAGAEQVGSAIEIDRLADWPVHDDVREVADLAFQQQGGWDIVGSHVLHCRYEERQGVRAATEQARSFRYAQRLTCSLKPKSPIDLEPETTSTAAEPTTRRGRRAP